MSVMRWIDDCRGWDNSWGIIPLGASGHPGIAQFDDPSLALEQDAVHPDHG